ncbi:MAG TPA: ABC transporter substrate-binding protein [Chloroflexota bacterium]|nr:ABC transporter substrate-binding protein [Chloroflexota bacterium]
MKSLGSTLAALLFVPLALAACGGGAAPAGSAPASPAPASGSIAPKPASAAPSASVAVKPASGAASAKPAASGAIPIKAGYPQATITQAPLFTAVDEGFFKNNALDVSIQQIGGPNEIPAALANETQFATVGATELANADQKGANMVMIATIIDYPFFWLYANKKYKTVQDLAGGTIGITAAGSSTDSAARLFLSHYGMLGKVKIAPAGGTQPSIFAAMTQGGIAAGILSPPVSEKAAQAGFTYLTDGVTLGVPMNTAGVVVTRAYLSAHADIVKRYLKSYQQGWSFVGNPANQAEAVKVLAKYTKSDAATIEPGYKAALKVWQGTKTPTVNPAAITNLLNLSNDPKVRATKPNDIIDNSILQSVQ